MTGRNCFTRIWKRSSPLPFIYMAAQSDIQSRKFAEINFAAYVIALKLKPVHDAAELSAACNASWLRVLQFCIKARRLCDGLLKANATPIRRNPYGARAKRGRAAENMRCGDNGVGSPEWCCGADFTIDVWFQNHGQARGTSCLHDRDRFGKLPENAFQSKKALVLVEGGSALMLLFHVGETLGNPPQ